MAFVHNTCFLLFLASHILKSFHLDIYRPSALPKRYSFSQQGAGVGTRGTIWKESQEKSCGQFSGSSSLAPLCNPLGNNREPTACIHLGKWQWLQKRKILGRSALFLDRKTKQMVDGVWERTHSVSREQIDWNFLPLTWNLRGCIYVWVSKMQASHLNCFQIHNWKLSTLW